MTWLEMLVRKTIKIHCPYNYFKSGLYAEVVSIQEDAEGNTIGCRGISCTQCWNQEASDDLA